MEAVVRLAPLWYTLPMIEQFSDRAAVYLTSAENRREIQKFVDIYLAMTARLYACDVSADAAFHRLYNIFYKLRFSGCNGHTSGEIYTAYYRLVEAHKREAEKPSIEGVLNELWALTGKTHLSFGSKLIATLYPDTAPVWDNNVRVLLEIPYPAKSNESRLSLAADAYHALEARYAAFAPTAEAARVLALFDAAFPNGREIAPYKKMDFLLWRMGSRRSRDTV